MKAGLSGQANRFMSDYDAGLYGFRIGPVANRRRAYSHRIRHLRIFLLFLIGFYIMPSEVNHPPF